MEKKQKSLRAKAPEAVLANYPKVLKVALCSFGMSGKLFHGPFFDVHPGFNLYACWERSKKLVHESYPAVLSFDDYDQMLADASIDLVVVNTPNTTHFEFAQKALNAGKHVLVEKPFTVTSAEAQTLIDLASVKGVKLSVYHNRRYDSDYRTIKKVLAEELLGPIVEAEFHFDRFVEGLSYKTHKETPVPGTGSLYDLGSHMIDQALQLFGWPQAIFADIVCMRPITKVDDYYELLLYYPQCRVRLRTTYVAREPIPGYVIHGLKGSFIKAKTNIQEEALMKSIKPQGPDWGKEPIEEWGLLHTEFDGRIIKKYIPSEKGNYLDYFEQLYQAIANDKAVPVSGAEGKQVIQIIEAAFESSLSRKVVAL